MNEAEQRRAEVVQIEQSLTTLATLFAQVSEMVAQQDEQFISVEETSKGVEVDMGAA